MNFKASRSLAAKCSDFIFGNTGETKMAECGKRATFIKKSKNDSAKISYPSCMRHHALLF